MAGCASRAVRRADSTTLMQTINCLTVCYLMNSMFCTRCYLNVITLYTALELDAVIEHFRLTQIEGILSTDFF